MRPKFQSKQSVIINAPIEEVNNRIEAILDEIKINGPAKKLYDTMVKKIFSDNSVARKRPADKIEEEIKQFENRIHKLQDSFADNEIDADFLNNSSQRYKKGIDSLKKELAFNTQHKSEHQQYLIKGIDLLSDVSGFYQQADAQVKRKLLGSIFPENLFFPKKKVEPPV